MKRVLLLFTLLFLSTELFSQPQPPTDLTAVQTNWNMMVRVKLDWDASPTPQVYYSIYRKNGAIGDTIPYIKKYTHIMHTDFYDNQVQMGHTYTYYVTAYTLQGESTPSNIVEITLSGGGGQTGGIIKGRILADVTNLPIPGSRAQIISVQGGMPVTVMTNMEGYFSKPVPAGSYYVRSQAMGFTPEFFDNVPDIQSAQEIVIAQGDSVFLNIGLAPFVPPATFTVSGTVTDTIGNPLRAMIHTYRVTTNTDHHGMHRVPTDSLGHYTINVPENDTIVLSAMPMNFNYLPEFYNNKPTFQEADRIIVNGNLTGIDFSLSAKPVYANGIEGSVKNADLEPVFSLVTAFRQPDGNTYPHHSHLRRYFTITDSLGAYHFNNMLPAEYILLACPQPGYSRTYFRYDGQQTLNWYEADSVVVTETGVVPGINFTVVPVPNDGYATITGTAVDNSGAPVNAANIYALDVNNRIFAYAQTDINGNYIMHGLQPGEYQVSSDKVEYISGDAKAITISSLIETVQADFILNPDKVTGTDDNNTVVSSYELYQNYPNPFNPSTTIKFAVPEQGLVKIAVYDMLGREVSTLLNEVVNAGVHSIQFDASDLASGMYLYKIQTGNFSSAKKLMLLK